MRNLISALDKKHLGVKAVAGILGCTEKTAYNKIHGITEFTISEAVEIKIHLLPEYDIQFLFADNADEKAKTP